MMRSNDANTEPASVKEGADDSAPFFSAADAATLSAYLDWGATGIPEVRSRIKARPRDELGVLYQQKLRRIESGSPAQLIAFLLLAERYIELGIPPSLRPMSDDLWELLGNPYRKFALLIADLMWARKRHEGHTTKRQNGSRFFSRNENTPYFLASQLTKHGDRGPAAILIGLQLKKHAHAEYIVLRKGATDWIAPHRKQCSNAMRALEREQRRRDGKALMRGKCAPRGDYRRRFEVWKCSIVAGGSSADTARLYTALTELPMTRQVAAKLIGEAKRDVQVSIEV